MAESQFLMRYSYLQDNIPLSPGLPLEPGIPGIPFSPACPGSPEGRIGMSLKPFIAMQQQ